MTVFGASLAAGAGARAWPLRELRAEATPDGDACALRVGCGTLRALQGETGAHGAVKAMIRPERIVVEAHGSPGENRLPGMVERAVYVGSAHELHVRLVGGDVLKAMIANDGSTLAYGEGTPVALYLPPDALRVLSALASSGDRERGASA